MTTLSSWSRPPGAHFLDGDLKLVQALLGRNEAHPESVLTVGDGGALACGIEGEVEGKGRESGVWCHPLVFCFFF